MKDSLLHISPDFQNIAIHFFKWVDGVWFLERITNDLVMIYTTAENFSWFNSLNNVEESMRMDIKRYDNYNKIPDLAVRILTHPWHACNLQLR